jgi:hypothetical protein
MINKTILVFPSGQLNIDGQLTQYEDKYEFIIDNFKNPYIPDPQVVMGDKIIGRALDFTVMDDGLYCQLELDNDIDISAKYPHGVLDTYMDAEGIDYKYALAIIELNDEPKYIGNQYKQLNKELEVHEPSQYNTEGEWMAYCVPLAVNEGIEQDQAVAKCTTMWQNKATGETQTTPPEKKSKIDILSNIKKLVEKNGYSISDEKILEMFGVIQDGKGTLTKLNKKLDSSKNIHEIKVFPKKTVYIEKYDEHVKFDDKLFNEMIDAFKCETLFKPYMDVDHELKEKYCEIIDLTIKEDGLYATIEPNEKGRDAIKNNIYSYISPEWGDRTDTDGVTHKNVLWAITLTNIPALEGENPKLQDQMRLNKNKKGKFMTLTQRLATLEGKVSNYRLMEGEAPVLPPEILEALQMIKDAMVAIDELTMQNQEVVEEKEAALLAKETAEKIATDTQAKLNEIEGAKLAKEKEDFFLDVVSKGQLDPSEVEEWEKQYDTSKDFVVKILITTVRNIN